MNNLSIKPFLSFSELLSRLKLLVRPWILGLIVLIVVSTCIWAVGAAISYKDNYFLAEASRRLILICMLTIIWLVLFWQPKHSAMPNESIKTQLPQMLDAQEKMPHSIEKLSAQYQALSKIEHEYRIRNLSGYLVVGSIGAGKSALLTNSSLNFPLQRQLSALSSSQQWWLSEEAIFAEINWDYSEMDLSYWQITLNLLKKYFYSKRWSGLIVCYPVHALNSTTMVEAGLIRDCYQRFVKTFGRELPVYLMITQCDQLEGFSECFSTLDDKTRQDYWGMFFPTHLADKQTQTLPEIFREKLADLIFRVQTRLIHFLQPHPNYDARRRAYQLPSQLEQLCAPLQVLLEQAFVVNRYQTDNPLRGIFFCSSGNTQQIMNVSSTTQASRQLKGYFIQNLFTHLISNEKLLARAAVKAHSKKRQLQYVLFTALILCELSASVLWTNSYRLNTNRLVDLKVAINNQFDAIDYATDPLTQLLQAQRLTTLFPLKHSASMGWGLYLYKPIGISIAQFYSAVAERYLISGLKIILEQELQTQTGINLYKTLSVYLMLNDVQRRQLPLMTQWYDAHSQKILSANHIISNNIDKLTLTLLLNSYFSLAKHPIAINFDLVEKARQQLRNLPAPKLAYLNYIYHQTQPDLVFDDSSIFNFSRVFQHRNKQLQIPFIFSNKGYHEKMTQFIKQSTDYVVRFDWVLDIRTYHTGLVAGELKNYIAALYCQDYYEYWLSSLNNLQIIHFENLPHAEATLLVLTQPLSPLQGVLSLLQKNIAVNQVQIMNMGDVGLSTSRNTLTHLVELLDNKNEAKLKYQTMVKALADLQMQLHHINNAQNPGKMAFNIAKAAYQNTSGNQQINQLLDVAKQVPKPVSQWLQNIAEQSWQLILAQSKVYIEQQWQHMVFTEYQNSIANYYPFASQNERQIDMSTFTRFFNQQGILANFMSNFIQPFAENDARKLTLVSLYGKKLPLTAATLQQINTARRLTTSLFAKGNEPTLTLIIRPRDLDPKVLTEKFSNNQTQIIYRHGPEFDSQIHWLNQELNQQCSLSLYLTNGQIVRRSGSGSWALFKLLDQGKLIIHDDRSASLNFQLGSIHTAFMLTSDNPEGMKVFKLLKQFKLPRNL